MTNSLQRKVSVGLAAAAMALAGLLSTAGPAMAAAEAVAIKGPITLAEGAASAEMTVRVKCPAGSTYTLDPQIVQVQLAVRLTALYDTPSGISGTCTGKNEKISVTLTSTSDAPCFECPAYVPLTPTSSESAQWVATSAHVDYAITTGAVVESGSVTRDPASIKG